MTCVCVCVCVLVRRTLSAFKTMLSLSAPVLVGFFLRGEQSNETVVMQIAVWSIMLANAIEAWTGAQRRFCFQRCQGGCILIEVVIFKTGSIETDVVEKLKRSRRCLAQDPRHFGSTSCSPYRSNPSRVRTVQYSDTRHIRVAA